MKQKITDYQSPACMLFLLKMENGLCTASGTLPRVTEEDAALEWEDAD